MAEAKKILSICATTSDRVSDLVIKDGQLIFVHDLGRLALDYKGKRTFYNQVIELDTDIERTNLENPVNGKYYFVINTAVFWRYFNGWQQLTSSPEEVLFIGTELPELGQANKIYVDKDDKEISVWDEDAEVYVPVANYTESISIDEIKNLFNN